MSKAIGLCEWAKSPAGWKCKTCGRVVDSSHSENGPLAFCVGVSLKLRRGLGDRVASVLDAIGITKQRVEAVVGGPCGCPERQAALNAAGAKWLGLPPGSTAPAEIDPGTP